MPWFQAWIVCSRAQDQIRSDLFQSPPPGRQPKERKHADESYHRRCSSHLSLLRRCIPPHPLALHPPPFLSPRPQHPTRLLRVRVAQQQPLFSPTPPSKPFYIKALFFVWLVFGLSVFVSVSIATPPYPFAPFPPCPPVPLLPQPARRRGKQTCRAPAPLRSQKRRGARLAPRFFELLLVPHFCAQRPFSFLYAGELMRALFSTPAQPAAERKVLCVL